MRLRFVSISAVVMLVCAAGCSLITSYDGFTGGTTDAGPSADVTTPADAGPSTEDTLCAPTIPGPPNVDKTEDPLTSYAGVVTAIRFTPKPGGCATIGKNLDGLDTVPGGDGGACVPGYGSGNYDLVGGIDDQSQTGLASFLSPSALTSLPDDIAMQRTGFVVTLTSYDGELNNTAVNVGFETDVGAGDGGTLVDETTLSGNRPLVETQGYVTNGVLVAYFGDTPLPFHVTQTIPAGENNAGVHGVTIPISYATLIGRPIVGDGGLTMDDAQLVGRIEAVDLFQAVSSLESCVNYKSVLMVCPELDLPSTPAEDGKSAYCGAISFALGFDLAPTVIAGTGPVLPGVSHCGSDSPPVTPTVCNPPSLGDGGDEAGDDAGQDAGDDASDAGDTPDSP